MATDKGEKKESGRYQVKIVGITPLLMDPMSEETVIKTLIRREREQAKTDIPIEQMAAAKLYKGPDGKFGIPVENLFSCLMEGGQHVKMDARRNVSTGDSSQLPSFLTLEESFLPFGDDEQEWTPDVRRGVMRTTGTAVGIVRPKFPKWSFTVTILVDFTVDGVTLSTVQKIFLEAGRRKGLGAFRPGCKGQFGKFRVEKFEEIAEESETTKAA